MSRLIIKESELSQIRKMYLIENVEDKKRTRFKSI